MLVSETLLSRFVTNAVGRISTSILDSWFAGLRFWTTPLGMAVTGYIKGRKASEN
jgi:hypothetical protein